MRSPARAGNAPRLHCFLEYELDEVRCELRCRGVPLNVPRKVFELIAYLAEERDRVVTRDELVDAVWEGQIVSDGAITQALMLARKALGDQGDEQRVIRTVRGRGVRFVAEVRSAPCVEVATPAPEALVTVEPSPPSGLLGRDRELEHLQARLARARGGEGDFLMLRGEPGIGKTSLAEELASRAIRADVEVFWGRAWEGGGAPPFWPWIQVLRGIESRLGIERMRELLGPAVGVLSPLLPELGPAQESRTHEVEARGSAREPDADGSRLRFRQFDGIARLLRGACGRPRGASSAERASPAWLIILDDLHAADEASLQLVRFVLPDLRQTRVLLVATSRDFHQASQPLDQLLETCGTERTWTLSGLDAEAAFSFLQAQLGPAVSRQQSTDLNQATGGNPLLMSALCQRVARNESLSSQAANFTLPERIASAVRSHLADLTQAAREALRAASAIGREFSTAWLAQLLDWPPARLWNVLGPALRRGVLRADVTGSRLSFTHAMICSAVYAELDPSERLDLHRRIGEVLERSHAPSRLPLHALAHHFSIGASAGCARKALDYSRRAAQQAFVAVAYESAGTLYDRALELSELEPLDAEGLHELLCGAGRAYSRAGSLELAAARFDRAAALARADQHAERLAEAVALCAESLRGTMTYDRTRQRAVREALALLPVEDSPLRARLLSISTAGMRSPETREERDQATLGAVDMARRLGDPKLLLWTLNARHLVLWGASDPEEAIEVAKEMVQLGEALGDRELYLDALIWMGIDNLELGDPSASVRAYFKYVTEAAAFGGPWHRYLASGLHTLATIAQGDFSRARTLSQATLELGLQVQDGLARPFHALRLLFLDLAQGALEGAQPGLRREGAEPPEFMPEEYWPFWALAWAEQGRLDDARRMVQTVVASQRELLDCLHRPTLAVMARTCVITEDRASGEQLYELLAPYAGRQLALQACLYMGPVDFSLGILSHLLGQRTRAERHFRDALRATFAPALLAETQYSLGRMLSEDRAHRAEARQLLQSADLIAQRLGMRPLQRSVQTVLEPRARLPGTARRAEAG